MKRIGILTAIIVFLIILDQVTKNMILSNFVLGETKKVIDGFFSLAYVQNTGAAFGIFRDGSALTRNIFILGLPVIFCGWIVFTFVKTATGPMISSVAYALILAGAIGNLIDRFRLGFVVDMFMFYWKKEENHFHVFNVADSCINVAAGLLIFQFIQEWRKSKVAKEA